MENRYINRYNSFCNSLDGLKKAQARDPEDDFVLSGTIQKFNLTFDIAWKVMKDIIVKYYQIQEFAAGSPRETLRTAKSVNLISDDAWLLMLRTRNELAHDYDGSLAKACFDTILTDYIPLFEQFRDIADSHMEKMETTSFPCM